MLALAGLVRVPYDPVLLLGVFGLQLLIAFTVTAFGVMVAATIKRAQTFTSVVQMLVMPMIFLSGALYPISDLPAWLGVLNRLNPLTYAVDPLRRLVFDHLDIAETARRSLAPGVTWWGWHVPALVEVGIVLVLGLAMLTIAMRQFSRNGVTPGHSASSLWHRVVRALFSRRELFERTRRPTTEVGEGFEPPRACDVRVDRCLLVQVSADQALRGGHSCYRFRRCYGQFVTSRSASRSACHASPAKFAPGPVGDSQQVRKSGEPMG